MVILHYAGKDWRDLKRKGNYRMLGQYGPGSWQFTSFSSKSQFQALSVIYRGNNELEEQR